MGRSEVPLQAGKSIRLPAQASSASLARDFVRSQLQAHGHSSLIDIALLCVSELVANAAKHTESSECVVSVADGDDTVRIEVVDESKDIPVLKASPPGSETGRGLFIVAALSTEWGVRISPGNGKSIWLYLADAT